MHSSFAPALASLTDHILRRLLDKIAKQILVCENKTIKPWDGTITEYKNYLRKKMISAGAV
jgi:ATP-binding cassette, subfamily F, member 2